jgi:hypothetical protein
MREQYIAKREMPCLLLQPTDKHYFSHPFLSTRSFTSDAEFKPETAEIQQLGFYLYVTSLYFVILAI